MHYKEELYHYGKPGMKWGKRKVQKFQEGKEELLKTGSAKKIYKQRKYLTQKELDSTLPRLRMDREIANLAIDDISKGARFAKAFLATATVAVTTYELLKSPLAKEIGKKLGFEKTAV